jgi:Polyketide cyclase / dehydrase and lipid transport
LIYIGIIIAVLIVALLVYIGTRPADFRIERSAQMSAPGDAIFSIINDLHEWGRWSPYDKRDPEMKKTFEGPPRGPGATYAWTGNRKVGEGRLTIVESKPGQLVSMKLEFARPFKCTNRVNFTLAPSTDGTLVSWIMEGRNNFMAKAFSLIINMDKMVGSDFETGLANLKSVVERTEEEGIQ